MSHFNSSVHTNARFTRKMKIVDLKVVAWWGRSLKCQMKEGRQERLVRASLMARAFWVQNEGALSSLAYLCSQSEKNWYFGTFSLSYDVTEPHPLSCSQIFPASNLGINPAAIIVIPRKERGGGGTPPNKVAMPNLTIVSPSQRFCVCNVRHQSFDPLRH